MTTMCLAAQFSRWCTLHPRLMRSQPYRVSYRKATPYLPLIDLLKAYFKIDQLDNTRAIRAKVTGQTLELDEALKQAVPAVLWLIEALPPDDRFLALAPEQRRQRTL